MTKQNKITWALLMVLTVSAGLISSVSMTYKVPVILLLAGLKFIGVAFYFMEMKKANSFWKVLLMVFIILFYIGILVFR